LKRQQVLVLENKSWFLNASETPKLEVKVMKTMLTALVAAATIAGAAVATSAPAEARWGGGGWGWGLGGFAAGAIVGSALAAPYYYGGYGPYGYYSAPYPYYGPPCVWRRVWNGYVWTRACI
jgi:hypothetical protein